MASALAADGAWRESGPMPPPAVPKSPSRNRRRGHDKPPTELIAFKFGLRPPVEGWDERCEQEINNLSVDLWNHLVALDQECRAKIRALTADDPLVRTLDARREALTQEIDQLIEQRQRAKQKVGYARRKAAAAGESLGKEWTDAAAQKDQELGAAIDALDDKRRAVFKELKAARHKAQAAIPGCQERIDSINEEKKAAIKAAYQAFDLRWGTKNAVIDSFRQGRSRAFEDGGRLREKGYGAKGRIVNQIQGGTSVADLFAGRCTQVKVAPLPDPVVANAQRKPWEKAPGPSGGRKARYTTLTAVVYGLRKDMHYVTWPMYMDRDISDEWRIKEVVITRRRVGPKLVWHAVFVCERPLQPRPEPTGPIVAVEIGWRRVGDGVRAAVSLADERGAPDATMLSSEFLELDERIRKVKGGRDNACNMMQDRLERLPWEEAPKALRKAWRAMADNSKSGTRALARFTYLWRREHADWCPGDLADLDRWRSQDKKEWEVEARLRQRLAGRRRMLYHIQARSIVEGASMVVVDKLDIAQSARNPKDGSSRRGPKLAQRYRVLACTHELREWIGIKAARAGIPLVKFEGSSRVCYHCGAPREKAKGDKSVVERSDLPLHATCRGCRRSYDQDINDCRYMLRKMRERFDDGRDQPSTRRDKAA